MGIFKEVRKSFVKFKRARQLRSLKKKIKPCRTVCFAIRTTGVYVKKGDELLQFVAIDDDGNVLFNEKFKPRKKKEWNISNRISGAITPDMVKHCHHFSRYWKRLQSIILSASTLVSYNEIFDFAFLKSAKIDVSGISHVDVMKKFSEKYGEKNSYGQYKLQYLSTCAAYYKYDYDVKVNDCLEDAKAILHCYKAMNS